MQSDMILDLMDHDGRAAPWAPESRKFQRCKPSARNVGRQRIGCSRIFSQRQL